MYKFNALEESQMKSKKNDLPFRWLRNCSHILRSSFTSRFKRIKWVGRRTPTMTLIIHLRNVLPGKTTEHVKFNSPIRDCISFRETFLCFKNSRSMNLHFSNLSFGRRASIAEVSSSIPANIKQYLDLWFFPEPLELLARHKS